MPLTSCLDAEEDCTIVDNNHYTNILTLGITTIQPSENPADDPDKESNSKQDSIILIFILALCFLYCLLFSFSLWALGIFIMVGLIYLSKYHPAKKEAAHCEAKLEKWFKKAEKSKDTSRRYYYCFRAIALLLRSSIIIMGPSLVNIILFSLMLFSFSTIPAANLFGISLMLSSTIASDNNNPIRDFSNSLTHCSTIYKKFWNKTSSSRKDPILYFSSILKNFRNKTPFSSENLDSFGVDKQAVTRAVQKAYRYECTQQPAPEEKRHRAPPFHQL